MPKVVSMTESELTKRINALAIVRTLLMEHERESPAELKILLHKIYIEHAEELEGRRK